jgi:hypothetical protein
MRRRRQTFNQVAERLKDGKKKTHCKYYHYANSALKLTIASQDIIAACNN